MDFTDYVSIHSCTVVCGAITDDNIIAQVVSDGPTVDDDDSNEKASLRPLLSQVMKGLNRTRLFFSFEEVEEAAFRHIQALEDKLRVIGFTKKKKA